MAGWPEPEVGLVVSYSYLWSEEANEGQVEGRKGRPCAIILVVSNGSTAPAIKRVAVVPITHSEPLDLNAAVEIPSRVKKSLGLDSERSWVILSEINHFAWPGFDLKGISRGDSRIDYGYLPPKLFEALIAKFRELRDDPRYQISEVSRDHG